MNSTSNQHSKLNRRQILSGIVGLGLGTLIPNVNFAKSKEFILKRTKISIQLTVLKSTNTDFAQVYYCDRPYKKETQPLHLLKIPFIYDMGVLFDKYHVSPSNSPKEDLKNYVKNCLEHKSIKNIEYLKNTRFVLFKGPQNKITLFSFDKGYILFNEEEFIKDYRNYDFSTEL